MSRTIRDKSNNKCALRSPKTFNEIRQLKGLLSDMKGLDLRLSGKNRLHRRVQIPTAWDDILCSGNQQMDFKV